MSAKEYIDKYKGMTPYLHIPKAEWEYIQKEFNKDEVKEALADICMSYPIPYADISEADALDAGMIFGAGFPPFRGGPMHYIAEQGEPLLLQRLNLLAQRYGQRFLPDAGWTSLKLS